MDILGCSQFQEMQRIDKNETKVMNEYSSLLTITENTKKETKVTNEHFRLLTFLLFSLSDFLAFVAIYIPYTYLPPLAIAHNILPGLRTCFFCNINLNLPTPHRPPFATT